MAYKRTEVYKDSNNKKPKELFIWLLEKLTQKKPDAASILDVGAASGAFLEFIGNRLPYPKLVGIEYDAELVKAGKENELTFELKEGDANKLLEQTSSFDVVFMTGTHSIFPDFRASFHECIRVASNGGVVFVTGIFNDFPVDAQIQWKYASKDMDWQDGYNLFSKKSVGDFLNSVPTVKNYEFEKFEIALDLDPQPDPIRSWTRINHEGKRELLNGLMPLNIELLTIDIGE